MRLVGSLTLNAGDTIWLSTTGRGTNVEPTGSGAADKVVGRVTDASGYAGGAPDPTATVKLEIQPLVIRA